MTSILPDDNLLTIQPSKGITVKFTGFVEYSNLPWISSGSEDLWKVLQLWCVELAKIHPVQAEKVARMLLNVLPFQKSTVDWLSTTVENMGAFNNEAPVILAKVGTINAYVSYLLRKLAREDFGVEKWHHQAALLFNQLFDDKPDKECRQYLQLELNYNNEAGLPALHKIQALESLIQVARREANYRLESSFMQQMLRIYQAETMLPIKPISIAFETHQMKVMHDAVGLVRWFYQCATMSADGELTLDGSPILHQAVQSNCLAAVRLLLQKGVHLEQQKASRQSALHLAASGGYTEIALLLLEYKESEADQTNKIGETALHAAAENGHAEIVTLLLDNGWNKQAKTNSGVTALHLAAGTGHQSVVVTLLEYNTDVDTTDQDLWTPLHWAAGKWQYGVVYELLRSGADIGSETREGQTALSLATKGNQQYLVELLLAHEAEVNTVARDGITPLHVAAQSGGRDMIKLLLEHGANISAATTDGKTALHFAAGNGDPHAVDLLLKHGADIQEKASDGKNALHFAARKGDVKMVCHLLHCQVDTTAMDHHGGTVLHSVAASKSITTALELVHLVNINAVAHDGTVLHVAVENGDTDMVKLVLDFQADVSILDLSGRTPLHIAAHKGFREIIEMLLGAGSKSDIADGDGKTALHLAAGNGDLGAVGLLLNHGADISAVDNTGKRPGDLARLGGHRAVAELLLPGEEGCPLSLGPKKNITGSELTALSQKEF